MRVKVCAINVGGGTGNRALCMEMFSFVDVFFIIDPPVAVGGGFMQGEDNGFDVFSFVRGGGMEVYVRREMVGLFGLERHDERAGVIGFEDMRGEGRMLAGVYMRPNVSKGEFEDGLESVVDCDIALGDWNARNI